MQHPISIAMQFLVYASCIALGMWFVMSYKVDPRAIPLAVVWFGLAGAVLAKSWQLADADALERHRQKKK